MTRMLMSGNEAAARGAWEAGVMVGVGYPGTPSTEVLENLVRYEGVRCEWAPNEKVAAEVAGGASLGGVRSLVTMKHVGLNVAADTLYTQAYTGIEGGLVYVVADDPGIHSSQNEQDTRNHAAGAHVPVLEPSDSQEALDFVRRAFEISEQYDIPVIVRMTMRVSHGKGLVEVGNRREPAPRPFHPNPRKYVCLPVNARPLRVGLRSRLEGLSQESESARENRIEMRDPSLGIITSGVTYEYVREALPDASVLKLGMPIPLPDDLVLDFASNVARVAVVEELDPFIRLRVNALGVHTVPTGLSEIGELSPAAIRSAFSGEETALRTPIEGLPGRPPIMCAGCPHRGVFHALSTLDAAVMGDIGCYTLAALPPLSSMHTCVCMGASIGMAHGLSLADTTQRPVVAVIGDSTFAHSGLTGLLHLGYTEAGGTVIILDNHTTAMTGHQGNPVSGVAIDGSRARAVDLEALSYALGAVSVRTIDPHDPVETRRVIAEEMGMPHLSVIIALAPCVLLTREKKDPCRIDQSLCQTCGACLGLGCPAISCDDSGRPAIDLGQCAGCGQCARICPFDAIAATTPASGLGGHQ